LRNLSQVWTIERANDGCGKSGVGPVVHLPAKNFAWVVLVVTPLAMWV